MRHFKNDPLEPGDSPIGTFQVPGICGYTGQRPCKSLTDPPGRYLDKGIGSAIPGYTGYVPLKTSESVFGRRFAAVTSACMNYMHRT